MFIPASSPGSHYCSVEEKVGAHFSLLCELVFSQNETGFDGHVSWIRKSPKLNTSVDFDSLTDKNLGDFYNALAPTELNRAEKEFAPLQPSDNGSYICFTVKLRKYITLDLLVRDDERLPNNRTWSFREMYCSDTMFKCMSNGVCIIAHYVCDGKADCRDGSDETPENCNGDPCKDKLKCDDGRCIPSAWCCDRHRDANCTVTNRPKCCQQFDDHEDEDVGLPDPTPRRPSVANSNYIVYSVCLLGVLIALVLLLLILSKVVIFAKRTSPQQQPPTPDVVYDYRGARIRPVHHISYDICPVRDVELRTFDTDEFESVDPLIRLGDRPPAYGELGAVFSDPPPPYTSREVLND